MYVTYSCDHEYDLSFTFLWFILYFSSFSIWSYTDLLDPDLTVIILYDPDMIFILYCFDISAIN